MTLSTEWSHDISNRLNCVENNVAQLQGKDERDHERLQHIETKIDDIDKKITNISAIAGIKGKVILFGGWILMCAATIVSGSDRFLHHIGLL